jgi:hypothetical protein
MTRIEVGTRTPTGLGGSELVLDLGQAAGTSEAMAATRVEETASSIDAAQHPSGAVRVVTAFRFRFFAKFTALTAGNPAKKPFTGAPVQHAA